MVPLPLKWVGYEIQTVWDMRFDILCVRIGGKFVSRHPLWGGGKSIALMSWIRCHYSKRKKVRKGWKENLKKGQRIFAEPRKQSLGYGCFFFFLDLVLGKKISDRALKTDSDSVIQTAGGNSFHHLGARTETWALINVFLASLRNGRSSAVWGLINPFRQGGGFISCGPSIRALKHTCLCAGTNKGSNKEHGKAENKLRLGINLNGQIELAI